MPIQAHRQPFTLQEKIEKAINITYNIKGSDDAEFMRQFLYDIISKALNKIDENIDLDKLMPKQ